MHRLVSRMRRGSTAERGDPNVVLTRHARADVLERLLLVGGCPRRPRGRRPVDEGHERGRERRRRRRARDRNVVVVVVVPEHPLKLGRLPGHGRRCLGAVGLRRRSWASVTDHRARAHEGITGAGGDRSIPDLRAAAERLKVAAALRSDRLHAGVRGDRVGADALHEHELRPTVCRRCRVQCRLEGLETGLILTRRAAST